MSDADRSPDPPNELEESHTVAASSSSPLRASGRRSFTPGYRQAEKQEKHELRRAVPIGKFRLRVVGPEGKPQPGTRLSVTVMRGEEPVAEKAITAGPTGYASTDFRIPNTEQTRIRVAPLHDREPEEDPVREEAEEFTVSAREKSPMRVLRLRKDRKYQVADEGFQNQYFTAAPDVADFEAAPELFHPIVFEEEGSCRLDYNANVETRQFYFNQIIRRGSGPIERGPKEDGERVSLRKPVPYGWNGEDEAGRLPNWMTPVQGPTVGKLNVYKQSWTRVGHGLGQLLYSLPLAPCEETQIAVIEWSREERGRRRESTEVTERVSHKQRRDRMIEESVKGAVDEVQKGFSGSAQLGGGRTAGAAGKAGGALASIGSSLGGSIALSGSYTQGHREVTANTIQNLEDTVVQQSNSLRSRRSMVVTQSKQVENENIRTRTVRNKNRNHAMTVEYFQVLEHYKVETALVDDIDVLLIPYSIPTVLWEELPALDELSATRTAKQLKGALYDAGDRIARELKTNLSIDGQDVDLTRPLQSAVNATFREALDSIDRPADLENRVVQITEEVWKTYKDRARGAIVRQVENAADVDIGHNGQVVVAIFPFGGSETDSQFSYQDLKGAIDDLVTNALSGLTGGGNSTGSQGLLSWLDAQSEILRDLVPDEYAGGFDALYHLRNRAGDLGKEERLEKYRALERLVEHIQAHRMAYLRRLWLEEDSDRRALRLEQYTHSYKPPNGPEQQVPILQLIENRPVGVLGNSVAFPLQAQGQFVEDNGSVPIDLSVEESHTEKLVSLPTRGIYAETLLSKCSAAEVRDVDRMVDSRTACDVSAPEISEVKPGSRAGESSMDLTPSDMPSSSIEIKNAPSAPAPTTASDLLDVLESSDIFRDMSLGSETAKAAKTLVEKALNQSGSARKNTLENLSTLLEQASSDSSDSEKSAANSALIDTISALAKGAESEANEAFRGSDPVRIRDLAQVIEESSLPDEKKERALARLHHGDKRQ